MLAAAEAGAFDVLLVGYTARYMRDLALALSYRRWFHRQGVVVYICDDRILSSNPADWERFVDKCKAADADHPSRHRPATNGSARVARAPAAGGDAVAAAQLTQAHGAGDVLALERLVVANPVRGGRLRLSRPPAAPRCDRPEGTRCVPGGHCESAVRYPHVSGMRESQGRPGLLRNELRLCDDRPRSRACAEDGTTGSRPRDPVVCLAIGGQGAIMVVAVATSPPAPSLSPGTSRVTDHVTSPGPNGDGSRMCTAYFV